MLSIILREVILATMFISKGKSKILENDQLQQIKTEMRKNHPEKFSRFDGKNRNEFINDSAKSYLEEYLDNELNCGLNDGILKVP